MHSSELDSIDWNILSALQENARIANVDLADKVHLSPSPCLARVKALEQEGFISRYVTLVNAQAVGLGVSVFVQVRLEKQVEASLNTFEKAIAARPEVMECYLMTGSSDYLLRVVVSDLQEFQRFVTDVSKIPGVGNIQSSVALKQVKYKTALPLPIEPPPEAATRFTAMKALKRLQIWPVSPALRVLLNERPLSGQHLTAVHQLQSRNLFLTPGSATHLKGVARVVTYIFCRICESSSFISRTIRLASVRTMDEGSP